MRASIPSPNIRKQWDEATLDETHCWVDDEEVSRRRDELHSGQVKGLSLEEFKVACGR